MRLDAPMSATTLVTAGLHHETGQPTTKETNDKCRQKHFERHARPPCPCASPTWQRRQLGRNVPDRLSRLFLDLHRNRDHPVNAPGVLGGLLHHVAVMRALGHEVAAGYQICAPEFSDHAKASSDSPRSLRLKA